MIINKIKTDEGHIVTQIVEEGEFPHVSVYFEPFNNTDTASDFGIRLEKQTGKPATIRVWSDTDDEEYTDKFTNKSAT